MREQRRIARRQPVRRRRGTHVARVAQRLGLSQASEPGKIELDLCAQFAEESWSDSGHRLLLHGRYTCLAKSPLCVACPLNELCGSRLSAAVGGWKTRAADEAERVAAGIAANRAPLRSPA